ncbi:MAG: HAMP domain-containing protein [Nitrospirae bacterium]|nr:HAMP domain-containing protein [Nitrospirota bacterium]
MNKVSIKLIIILILSALVPMTLFGMIAVWTARKTAREIVAEENLQVAKRAAQQIEQHITNNTMVLEALTQNLAKTDLKDWQKERIIKNYTLQFEQFRSIDLTDRLGRTVTTSRLDASAQNESQTEAIRTALSGEVYRSEVFISKNFTPDMTVAIPLKLLGEIHGAVVGELNLIEMWRLVDSIRIGREGHAFVVSKEGLLIAHGLDSAKERVFRQEQIGQLPIVQSALKGEMKSFIYADQDRLEQIGVSVPIPSLGWALVIEQPTREAYAAAARLTYQLTILVVVFLLLMILIGLIGGRRYIVTPIQDLIRGIRAVGEGNLTDKVKILTRDEFRELGDAFNQMTERLSALKEDIRRNERAVFLGRIASGLVHDLRHPVKNLENSSHLVLRHFDDSKIRDVFRGIVEREFPNLNRFFDDLYNLTRPTPISPVLLNLSSFISDLLEPFRIHPHCVIEGPGGLPVSPSKPGPPEDKKILISVRINPPDLKVWADRFGLERVLKNVIVNAVEAMPKGGRLFIAAETVSLKESPEPKTEIAVSDTGGGIPPERLNTLFVDYATTKRKGLGLGLAICKKIAEEHKATIEVKSRPGYGTTVILRFPTA